MKNFKQYNLSNPKKVYDDLIDDTIKSLNLNESSNAFDDLVQWMQTLDIKKRTPRGMKAEAEMLKHVQKRIDLILDFEAGNAYLQKTPDNIKYYEQSKIDVLQIVKDRLLAKKDQITDKFGMSAAQPNIIEGKYATYVKEDSSAYKKFTDGVANLEKFFSTLKGKHAVPLKNLKVVFTNEIKSIGKYMAEKDYVAVNSRKTGNTLEKYGSLRYVILHELGHRYLKTHPQRWNIDGAEWITTKYSTVDSFTGEEKFAELFAITHWETMYSQYKDTMAKFKKVIK